MSVNGRQELLDVLDKLYEGGGRVRAERYNLSCERDHGARFLIDGVEETYSDEADHVTNARSLLAWLKARDAELDAVKDKLERALAKLDRDDENYVLDVSVESKYGLGDPKA